MARTRALITQTERRQLTGEEGEQRKYEAATRIRSRIEDELSKDVAVLVEHHPGLLAEVRDVVCPNED